MKRSLITIILALTFSLGTPHLATALQGGNDASNSPYVVGIYGWSDNSNPSLFSGCSGAAISPRIVFTASHCLLRLDPNNKLSADLKGNPFVGILPESAGMYVSLPGDPGIDGWKRGSRVLAQFALKESNNLREPYRDFGILVLEKAITNQSHKIATRAQIQSAIDNQSTLYSLGYGFKNHQDFLNNMAGAGKDPKPSILEVKARETYWGLNNNQRNFSDGFTLTTLMPIGSALGGGDSGGPLWLIENNEWFFVGTACCSQGPNAQFPQDHPSWTEQYSKSNPGGKYETAQAYFTLIEEAEMYLKQIVDEEKAAAEKAAAEKAAAEQAAAAQRKSTIKCVKGKIAKKVTALNPKCPKGYKIK